MSEYQYYEFQAIDRPLTEADRQALRALSTRAQITATSFSNTYEWGDLKGDPVRFMETWFDLHLYLANWGSRRLMIRAPARLLDRDRLNGYLAGVDCAKLRAAGENLILDIGRDELNLDWEDGSGWLAALTPLRADILSDDLRLFYLLWLIGVEDGAFEGDAPEPMPGIGPITGPLEAFAEFFAIDPDLVQAAAERSGHAGQGAASTGAAHGIIAAMTAAEKTAWLTRVFDGDPYTAMELRTTVRDRTAIDRKTPSFVPRTAGELSARAAAIKGAREEERVRKLEAERKRRADLDELARQARLVTISRRGESVWLEVEAEIERRNSAGYDKAISLLIDLRAVAEKHGTTPNFNSRLQAIRERHARKARFVEQLATVK